MIVIFIFVGFGIQNLFSQHVLKTCQKSHLCCKWWRIDGWKDGWINGRSMDGQTDGWMDGCIDWWMDWWMDRLMDRWMDRRTEGRMDRRMEGWTDEWMNGLMDGWMNGWIDKWVDSWMKCCGVVNIFYICISTTGIPERWRHVLSSLCIFNSWMVSL